MKHLSHDERIEQFRFDIAEGNALSIKTPNSAIYEKLIKVLDEDYGYFDCPASLNHHGNYDGGLLEHSMAVAKNLEILSNDNGQRMLFQKLAYRVGLFHDICKCVQYMQAPDGTWFWNENCIWDGHGSLSVMLTQKIFADCEIEPLSFEELACIRWHMGAFDKKDNWGFYTRAVREYPAVLWTHTSDMMASQIEGV